MMRLISGNESMNRTRFKEIYYDEEIKGEKKIQFIWNAVEKPVFRWKAKNRTLHGRRKLRAPNSESK